MVGKHVRLLAMAVVGVVVCVASGCDGGSGGDTGEHPSARATPIDQGFTAPGTRLHVGGTATVPTGDGSAIELTVTEIAEGTSEDLQSTGLAGAARKIPYYVSYEMRVVSGNAAGSNLRHYLSAWAHGEQAAELTTFRRFPVCQQVEFPATAVVGTTVRSCRTYVVDRGSAPVDTVHFDDDADYENGDGTDIEWG